MPDALNKPLETEAAGEDQECAGEVAPPKTSAPGTESEPQAVWTFLSVCSVQSVPRAHRRPPSPSSERQRARERPVLAARTRPESPGRLRGGRRRFEFVQNFWVLRANANPASGRRGKRWPGTRVSGLGVQGWGGLASGPGTARPIGGVLSLREPGASAPGALESRPPTLRELERFAL